MDLTVIDLSGLDASTSHRTLEGVALKKLRCRAHLASLGFVGSAGSRAPIPFALGQSQSKKE